MSGCYKIKENTGDAVPVPQLVFAKLGTPDAGEARFRVALFLLAKGRCEAAEVSRALHIRPAEAEKALHFWEGAGLLEQEAGEAYGEAPEVAPAPRTLLSPEKVRSLAAGDPTLGALVKEMQYTTGSLLGHADVSRLFTLYDVDKFPADLILMAAHQCAVEKKGGMVQVERRLFLWRREGIACCEDADRYLKLQQQRAENEEKTAKLLGMAQPVFTLAERRRIAKWYEEFHFGQDMIEAARMAAGEKQNDVKYLHKILEKWHAQGLNSPRQLQQAQGATNLRVQRAAPKAETGARSSAVYVPLAKRKEQP